MKKTTIVVALLLLYGTAFANNITSEINEIESEWAQVYYAQDESAKKNSYLKLIKKTESLVNVYPESVELKIWKAILISTNAEYENPFSALDSIREAKNILETAIQAQPEALEGAAFVALGTLYYMTPGWPISFGDQNKAEELLKKGVEINPDSIDSNYFYADYLLSKNKIKQATQYFKLALNAPVRPTQKFADINLKKEAYIALRSTEERKLESGKNKLMSKLSSAKSNQNKTPGK